MSKFSQDVKAILNDVHPFLTSIKDSWLSADAQAKKKQILAAIQEAYTAYPALAPALSTQLLEETPEDTYDDGDTPAVPDRRQPSFSASTKSVPATSPQSVASTDYQVPPSASEVVPDTPAQSLTNRQKAGFLGKEKKKSDILIFTLGLTQKRYCIIQDGVFYYYEKAESKKQSGAFKLADYEAAPVTEEAKDGSQKPSATVFQVTCPGKRSFTFKANDSDDMKGWIEAIAKASSVKLTSAAERSDASSLPQSPRPTGTLPRSPRPIGKQASPLEDVYDDAGTSAPAPNIDPSEDIYDDTCDTGQDVYDDTSPAKPPQAENPNALSSSTKANTAAQGKPSVKDTSAVAAAKIPPTTPTLVTKQSAKPLPSPPPTIEEPSEQEDIYADVDEPVLHRPSAAAVPPAVPTGLPSLLSRPLPPPPPAAVQETVTVRRDDYGNMYYGMWDCAASKDFELSFTSGEILHVIGSKYEDKGWWTAVLNGKVGLVPKNYLTPAYVRV